MKISLRRGGEGDDHFQLQDRHWCAQILPPSSICTSTLRTLLSLLGLPAVPPRPLRCVFSTTKWRRVVCSGNSVCRTHCWLSEVLWLFRRLLGASGPTEGASYHPLGLGTGSGSWDKKEESKNAWKQKHICTSNCLKRSDRNYMSLELVKVSDFATQTNVFSAKMVLKTWALPLWRSTLTSFIDFWTYVQSLKFGILFTAILV